MIPRLISASDLTGLGLDDRHLRRGCQQGRLQRVVDGVFVTAGDWQQLTARQKHVTQIVGTMQALAGDLVVSHESAAALWGLPTLDSWPAEVHVLDPRRKTGQRTAALVRHATSVRPTVARQSGVLCTTPARTAVDVGLRDGFVGAIVVFDGGLRLGSFSFDELDAEVQRRRGERGLVAVRRALPLADPRAASAGESISRANAIELGFPVPDLQKCFPNPWGGEYFVDFWWEESGIVGEFDGDQKYLDEAMRSGRTIEQVMLDEKRRADDILARPEVRNLVRWKYAAARNPRVLSRILLGSGLPKA